MSLSVSAPNQLLEHTDFMATDMDISFVTYFRLVSTAEWFSLRSRPLILKPEFFTAFPFFCTILSFWRFVEHLTGTKANADHLVWCGERKLIVQRGVGNWFSEVLSVQSGTQPILKLSTMILYTKFNGENWLDSNSFSIQIAVWSYPETRVLNLYSFVNL